MKLGSNEIGLVKVTELIHLSDIFCQLRISLNLAELQLSTFFSKCHLVVYLLIDSLIFIELFISKRNLIGTSLNVENSVVKIKPRN